MGSGSLNTQCHLPGGAHWPSSATISRARSESAGEALRASWIASGPLRVVRYPRFSTGFSPSRINAEYGKCTVRAFTAYFDGLITSDFTNHQTRRGGRTWRTLRPFVMTMKAPGSMSSTARPHQKIPNCVSSPCSTGFVHWNAGASVMVLRRGFLIAPLRRAQRQHVTLRPLCVLRNPLESQTSWAELASSDLLRLQVRSRSCVPLR